ncbi:cellulose binding domain-containing protein [Actinoplanes sp. NBC_00393]|uniref:cellulose binding domain-containing protein n=1 Tax=Actinoplanes sp. NBC_00393 TaxID=2975953 RepID=UPI003FA4891F
MHDWPANTIAALPRIAQDLRNRGLCSGMISPSTGRAVAPDTTTPPPSSSPPPPPSSSPPPVPTGCSATISNNAWTGGFVTTVKVTAGSTALNSWSVSITLPSGSTVTNSWNSQASGTSGTVRFANASYNGRVPAGGSTEFGFQGNGTPPASATCTAA